jgi:hypothetical protein
MGTAVIEQATPNANATHECVEREHDESGAHAKAAPHH